MNPTFPESHWLTAIAVARSKGLHHWADALTELYFREYPSK